ncbi:hypothetical protein pb186bvf_020237 [Paramecium bursaria]
MIMQKMDQVDKNLTIQGFQTQQDSIKSRNESKKIIQQYFQQIKIEPDTAILMFPSILYLLNQGESFDSSDLQIIICGVSKLFQFNNIQLRRMIYKFLKVIMDQQYSYIFTQSIIRDLMSTSQFIRLNSLRIIPFIKDESIVFQLEKYIIVAINDENKLISSTALIATLNLFRRFPNIVNKLSKVISEKLNEQYFESNIYALNIIQVMKQFTLSSLIKILHQLIKQPQNQMTNLQIIKIMRKIMVYEDCCYSDKFLEYIKSQVFYQEPIIFFEAIKQLFLVKRLTNIELEPYVKFVFTNLQHLENNIEIFISLKLISYLLQNPLRKQLLDKQFSLIASLTSNPNLSISSLAISILFQFYQKNIVVQELKKIYQSNVEKAFQINFLQGLIELMSITKKLFSQILQFISQAISEDCKDEIIDLVIQITNLIIIHQGVIKIETIKPLFKLIDKKDFKFKQIVVKIILDFYYKRVHWMTSQSIQKHYDFMKMKINEASRILKKCEIIICILLCWIQQSYKISTIKFSSSSRTPFRLERYHIIIQIHIQVNLIPKPAINSQNLNNKFENQEANVPIMNIEVGYEQIRVIKSKIISLNTPIIQTYIMIGKKHQNSLNI